MSLNHHTTNNFSHQIELGFIVFIHRKHLTLFLGYNNFKIVCYEKLLNGQEVVDKRPLANSQQGAAQFYNEINYFLTSIYIIIVVHTL